MKAMRCLVVMAAVVLAAAAIGVVGQAAQAAAYIEWDPERGFYLTETPSANAVLRLVGSEEAETESFFEVLQQMRVEEQWELAMRLRVEVEAAVGQGPAEVAIGRVLDVVGPEQAERIQAELRQRVRERLEGQDQGQGDGDDRAGGGEQQESEDRSGSQAQVRERVQLRETREVHGQETFAPPSDSSGPGSHDDDRDEEDVSQSSNEGDQDDGDEHDVDQGEDENGQHEDGGSGSGQQGSGRDGGGRRR